MIKLKTLTIAVAIFFIVTALTAVSCTEITALQTQTNGALVTMKSNNTEVDITLTWMPETAEVKANGIVLRNDMMATIPVNTDSTVVITTEENVQLLMLSCAYNKLTQLNVSKNAALIFLSCENNQLAQLDVSKNIVLASLDCDNNRLTQLDVSKNTILEELFCGSNQLTQLDVSKNTKLEGLFCYGNQLTRLDVSKNAKLEELDCDSNRLIQLDMSNNTILRELSCADNQLTQLYVSKNTVLDELDCENNQLTQLDVSKNTKLKWLYASGQQVKVQYVVGSTNFINPIFYKTSAGEEKIKIGTAWHAYNATIPKTGDVMEFSTNLPKGIKGEPFGGNLLF